MAVPGGHRSHPTLALAWGLARFRSLPRAVVLPLRALCWTVAAAAGGWATLLLGLPFAYDGAAETRAIAPGVTHRHWLRTDPRPHPVHVMEVELAQEGLRWVLTAPRATRGHAFAAMRTSDFLASLAPDCVAAINVSFFYPFHSRTPWDYYPHDGDGVDVLGRFGLRDDERGQPLHGALMSYAGRRVAFGATLPGHEGILEGRRFLVRDGRAARALPDGHPYPRMALGIRGGTLVAVAVDGKVDRLAEGLTLPELAALLLELGLEQAIELDGGGSVTMAVRLPGVDQVEVLNLVSHTRVPFRERPVATHLGVCVAMPPRT